jgi:hypothetical protein
MPVHRLIYTFIGLAQLFFIPSSFADLIVTPTRVDFNEKTKTATISLVSQSKDPATYKIGWISFTMQNDGSYQETKEPRNDAKSVESLIRFSPRQVTLNPGETQVIRISASQLQNLSPGEYRSHLVFRADPTAFAKSEAGSDGIAINLSVAKGIAIPIVFRKGNLQTKITLTDPKIIKRPDTTLVSVQINREGNASPFGDLEVRAIINDKEETIGILRGVAVFLEIPYRKVEIPISNLEKLKTAKSVRVIYLKTNSGNENDSWASSAGIKP